MSQSDLGHSSISSAMGPPPAFDGAGQRANSGIGAGGVLGQGNPLSLVQPDASSALQSSALNSNGNANQCKPCQKKMRIPLSPLNCVLDSAPGPFLHSVKMLAQPLVQFLCHEHDVLGS